MRVANYYRVSTKLQEEKFSLAAQREELTKYALSQGWTIVSEFKDVDSGGKLEKAGLSALLDLVEDGEIDVVLCIDQDRLSRLDTIAWEYLKSTLRDNNVSIAEPGRVVDLNNEDDEFISDIKNLIAKREKKSIVKRMMRGKRQRMREGKAWGLAPLEYTYNKSDGKYYAKEEWNWVIPFIDNLYLNEQLGMTLISEKLNAICKTPSGKLWSEHLIHTRLTSKAYHGVMEKEFANGEVITVPDIYEPLRSEETYNRIQIEKKNRAEQFSVSGRKNTENIHMLKRTNITCDLCGRIITVAQHGSKKTPRYYLKHGRKKVADGTACEISFNTVRIDNNIIKALKEMLMGEEMAKKYLNLEVNDGEIKEIKEKIKNEEQTVNKLHESLERLLDLYVLGKFKKKKYQEKEFEIENNITQHKKRFSNLNLNWKRSIRILGIMILFMNTLN